MDDDILTMICAKAEQMAADGDVAGAAEYLVSNWPEPTWDELERTEIDMQTKLRYVDKAIAAAPTLRQRREMLSWRKHILQGGGS